MGDVPYSFNITSMLELLDVPLLDNYSLEEYMMVTKDFKADNRWFSKEIEITIIVCFAIIILVGLISNGLVFFIIARKGCRQSSRNWYILNLAASDILTCAVCKPLTVVRLILKNWVLGGVLCKTVPSLQTVYVFVSTFTLVALAVDRYSAIIYNNHQARYKRYVCLCLALIWMSAIALSIPSVVVHDIEHVSFNGNIMYSICFEKWESEVAITSYTVLLLLLQYLSPLIAIVVLHLLIGRFLRTRFQTSLNDDANIRRKRRRHRKNIFLLSTMTISFGVAWFPLHFVNALATIDYPSFFTGLNYPLLHAICLMVAFSSVCFNPFIYGLLNTSFRHDLVKMCGGQAPRYSMYTDYTRRSSPNPEQLGLISSTPAEIGLSNTNLYRLRNSNCISAL